MLANTKEEKNMQEKEVLQGATRSYDWWNWLEMSPILETVTAAARGARYANACGYTKIDICPVCHFNDDAIRR